MSCIILFEFLGFIVALKKPICVFFLENPINTTNQRNKEPCPWQMLDPTPMAVNSLFVLVKRLG